MNREQKKARRREKRLIQKQRELQKDQDLEELEPEEKLDVLETENEPEDTQKDFYPEAATYIQVPGPTSFDELDQERVAQEKAAAVMDVTYDTEMLVRNILHHPEMDPDEKADAIGEVSDEFATRVNEEISSEQIEKDLDLLQLNAIVAKDRRSMSALEYVEDITKRVLSAAGRKSLSDSDFALVTTRNGKQVRKYPIHDKAHVRNALARAAQMIARGGQAASDARAALPKIHAAAKKFGIGSSTSKERNAILIEKDAKSQWRWVGWVSNNFIDWDGDIIAEDAHKEFVEWLDKNMDVSPVFVSWHTPGTARKSPVDFVMFENGFLIMSGPLQETEAAGLLKAQSKVDLGMSHGTLVLSRDAKDPRIITKYRMYEVSDLPLEKAANPWTDFETVVKEVGMDKKAYLIEVLGAEKATAFLEKTGLKQKALEEVGVESKEKTEEKPPVPEVKTDPAPAPAPAPVVNEAPKTQDITAEVLKALDVEGLNAFVIQAKEDHEKVQVLEDLVKDLSGKQDEKLAEKLTPPLAKFAWSQDNRPSKSSDNLVSKEEKDKQTPGVPKEYWLSEATNTEPVKVE